MLKKYLQEYFIRPLMIHSATNSRFETISETTRETLVFAYILTIFKYQPPTIPSTQGQSLETAISTIRKANFERLRTNNNVKMITTVIENKKFKIKQIKTYALKRSTLPFTIVIQLFSNRRDV